jgi:hypothetical protein
LHAAGTLSALRFIPVGGPGSLVDGYFKPL